MKLARKIMSLAELIDFAKLAAKKADAEGIGLYHTNVIAVDGRGRQHEIIGAVEYDDIYDAIVFRIR